jgi:hypothetical protein
MTQVLLRIMRLGRGGAEQLIVTSGPDYNTTHFEYKVPIYSRGRTRLFRNCCRSATSRHLSVPLPRLATSLVSPLSDGIGMDPANQRAWSLTLGDRKAF